MLIHIPLAGETAGSMNNIWVAQLRRLLSFGHTVLPVGESDEASLLNRTRATQEILHNSFAIDLNRPVLSLPGRAMNYSLMAAEALWILAGDNRVETIAPYTSQLAKYSDDGITFFGAYGPPIARQLSYVVETLMRDSDSRQAVIRVWREEPGATKNIPCTIALSFSLRHGVLHEHLYLRSSDTWLGLPYDVFGMACVAAKVASELIRRGQPVERLGNLYIVAASSHFYVDQFSGIDNVLRDYDYPVQIEDSTTLNWKAALSGDWNAVEEDLIHTRDKLVGLPIWLDIRPPWSYEKLTP